MSKLRSLARWLLGKPAIAGDPLAAALNAFRDPEAEALELIRRLVGVLRPQHRRDSDSAARYAAMLEQLARDPGLRADFRRQVVHFLATRRLVSFFTDSGLLPGTGFFSEWWHIIGNRLLPEEPDERQLKDCLHVIFERPDDWRWLAALPEEHSQQLWALLAPVDELRDIDWRGIEEQMLDAVLLLAHRISGLGIDEELMRASPDFDDHSPRFIALSAEALQFASAYRNALDDPTGSPDDGSHLQVIADQCRDTLQRIRKRALSFGTSLHLSYLLARSEQQLQRLGELLAILGATRPTAGHREAVAAWSSFAHSAFLAENRRNSLSHYLGQLSQLLATRVTENAARSGEHYICESRADYAGMWRSAAGAGVLIGLMALLKIFAADLHPPLAIEALIYSMIYGIGFVLIYLLGLTVATKQPAMTAQTLAGLLGDLRPTRNADCERLVDVAAAVSRSQLAAIAGNVMVALPVAIAAGLAWAHFAGTPAVPPAKARQLLADLEPLSRAIPFAAIAGFYLYLAGLITGYFDNHAAYSGIARRIARLRWLVRLAGRERAGRIGAYIEARLGGIMGNFLFGCMLGSTAILGTLLGLPLDIRHIAFSSANLGYALIGSGFSLPAKSYLWAALGVAAIGLTNLAVSFALALRTALAARDVRLGEWGPLLGALGERLRRQPRSFFLPPREADG